MADDFGSEHVADGDAEHKQVAVGGIVAIIVAAASAVFIFQNTDPTHVEFLFVNGEVPLFIVIIVSMVLGALLGWFYGFRRRRRKRHKAH
ncbi:MAG: LapA family protein [Actinomycetota bacterium]